MSHSASLPGFVPCDSASAPLPGLVRGLSNAWAAKHDASRRLYFAAVMGTSEECLAPTRWTGDSHLKAKGRRDLHDTIMSGVVDEPQGQLIIAQVNDYVEACLRRSFRRMSDRLVGLDIDNLTSEPLIALRRTVDDRDTDITEAEAELTAAIDVVTSNLRRMTVQTSPGMNPARVAVITKYDEQMTYLCDKAKELKFCDSAISSANAGIRALKSEWEGPAHMVYESTALAKLQKTRQNCEKDKEHIELDLQSYFDHHSHGASKSESARPDRKALSIVATLESMNAGFKQIQIVDLYCMSRGNELWAIIPDILRIGHDIDPIDCIHWRPSGEGLDDYAALSKYHREQNRAFAQKLLGLCSPGLRSTLIGQHEHGVKNEMFTADEHDGCALYWVMIQLFHPLSRQHRRKIADEIARYSSRFNSGDPKPQFTELRLKVQEAIDISARLNYDLCVTPLLDALCTRDAQFAVDLKTFRELPPDPDDSAIVLNKLIARALTITEQLDVAKKRWDEKGARAASKLEQRDVRELRGQITELKASIAKGDTSNPKYKTKPTHTGDTPSEGFCWAEGCGRKIEHFKKGSGWKLCTTCLLKARTSGNSLKLCNGQHWGMRAVAKAFTLMKKAGVPVKALAAKIAKKSKYHQALQEKRKAARSQKLKALRENDDDDDPDAEGTAVNASAQAQQAYLDLSKPQGMERTIEILRTKQRHKKTAKAANLHDDY